MGLDGLTDRICHRRSIGRWRRAAERARNLPGSVRESLHLQANELRGALDSFLRAETGPAKLSGGGMMPPAGSDWDWRPEPWTGPMRPVGLAGPESGSELSESIRLFHDCPIREITIRQFEARGGSASDPDARSHALMLDVLGFEGSFLSLVFDLPALAIANLENRHIITFATRVRVERSIGVFVRLNIRSGPNTEQIVRELPREAVAAGGEVSAEFDLAYAEFNEKRLSKAWIDMIFEEPAMSKVVFYDTLISRRRRAEL